jgi:hypothetical protein
MFALEVQLVEQIISAQRVTIAYLQQLFQFHVQREHSMVPWVVIANLNALHVLQLNTAQSKVLLNQQVNVLLATSV